LVYSHVMHKDEQRPRSRRKIRIGVAATAAVVMLVTTAVIVFFPRGLRGPETVARQFFEALVQTPDDVEGLRAAARIGESDDPQALIDGLSTRVALEFMRARERQGATYNVRVVEAKSPAARNYVTLLSVTDRADRASPVRRFQVNLKKADNGDWYVANVAVME